MVAVDSATNSERESRYSPVEGEALAIINGLRKMRFYLHGAAVWEPPAPTGALLAGRFHGAFFVFVLYHVNHVLLPPQASTVY